MTPPREPGQDSARPGLRASLATPDAKGRYVRRLFSTIADRYDLITVLLSCGLDQRWKRRLSALAQVEPGINALDLACGTGDIAFALSANGATTTALDITPQDARARSSQAEPREPAAVGCR